MTNLKLYFKEQRKNIEHEFEIFHHKDLHESVGKPMSLGQSQFVIFLIPTVLDILETFAKEIEELKNK